MSNRARLDRRSTPLTADEYRRIFDLVAAGQQPEAIRARLKRNRTTVNRAYRVAEALHRKAPATLSDAEAEEIAASAPYNVTLHYVERVFQFYQSWRRQGDALQQHARHRALLTHFDHLRSLAAELPQHLLLWWAPEEVWGLNLATGEHRDPLSGALPLRWEVTADGHCRRLLDTDFAGQFASVLAHLRAAGEQTLLQEYEKWQVEGGQYVALCYQLREEIIKAAEQQTGLQLIPDDVPAPVPGLRYGFECAIYHMAVAAAPPTEWKYTVGWMSSSPDVLLQVSYCLGASDFRQHHLAWVSSGEQAQLQSLHERLGADFRQSSLAQRIRAAAAALPKSGQQLSAEIARFCSDAIIPGTCPECAELQEVPS